MLTDARDDTTVFREYEPHELKAGRYPVVWDQLDRSEHKAVLDAAKMPLVGGVKDIVRQVTGHRCQRCQHPYHVGWGLGVWEPDAGASHHDFATQDALFKTGAASDVKVGKTHWSPCDVRCTHPGPFRCRQVATAPLEAMFATSGWTTYGPGAQDAGERVRAGREVQAAYRILTVHHLNERKHDLRWWNLAALCQRCHLTIQRKVTMEASYPWDHTEWFRPHAAAWYALKYLGAHLTYTQTIERLDELLALGKSEESTERMPL